MILTKIAPDRLRPALRAFAASLAEERARRVLRRIARLPDATRAKRRRAVHHHRQAVALAARFGMGLRPGSPAASYGWDGRAARLKTEAYVLLHEVAHYQLAPAARRRAIDFGLGPGPETGARDAAERAARLHGVAREREEAMASLLGILWEVELRQPALASFLDQNWLEGAGGPGAAAHFQGIVAQLVGDGFLTNMGRPTRRMRRATQGRSE